MNQYQAHDIIKQLYYPNESFPDNDEILRAFASPEEGIGIPLEFPDKITNVNGVHNYKLLSSKDINFNNVLLPNSIVPEANWGSFDSDRRWPSGSPVYINDVYELMNVVDYLLCATEDLWNEINRLKYGNATLNNLWFLNNLQNPINSINQIDSSQFTKASNYAVLLNPKAYFTTLPIDTMENFGIGTQFFDENHTKYPILRNIISSNTGNRNGIQGDITYEDHSNYFKTQNENLDGRIVPIYGYKIGTDLHFYPMFTIDNFLNGKYDDFNNYSSLIDYSKMKLKYDLYFRINNDGNNQSRFEKVYIDFLYNDWENLGRPFILYFIDENKKRHIIYIHTENGSGNKTVYQISQDLKHNEEYINHFYDVDSETNLISDFGSELDVYSVVDGYQYPYLYHVSDTSKIGLFVQTPNTPNFTLIQNTLQIPYFKNNNTLSATIKLPNLQNIAAVEDKEQKSGILYSPYRYNIPDNTDINIDIEGTFLDNDMYIKYDDEYDDYLIPNDGYNNYVTTDEEAQQYYYYKGLDSNGKRQFEQFTSAVSLNSFFSTNNTNSVTLNNIDSIKCAHVYKKNDEAYKLKYKVITNSLINQITDYPIVVEEAETIENNMSMSKDNEKHTLTFNYTLEGQLEQIKFDLDLYVEETSKVQSTHLNLPISLNKIHQPCIQFISKDIMEQEIKDYNDYLAYTFGDRSGAGVAQYKYTNKVPKLGMTNTFLIYGEGNTKTNQNIIQGTDDNDKFNSFKDLYTYVIERKYNKFENKDYNNLPVRTDILANIDQNNRYMNISSLSNLESTFDKQYTYDNSFDGYMRDLIISYHPENSLLNIIGGNIFENYLKSVNEELLDRQALAYFDNITYSPVLGENKYITFKSIFNINGLGFNYRLHGGDSYLYINKEGSGIGGHNNPTDLPFNNQYDLLCNGCQNTENNIIKFMQITLDDDDNQLATTIKLGSEIPDGSNTFIETNILDIEAVTYNAIVQKDFHRYKTWSKTFSVNNQNINTFTSTYYVPITYFNIKSTTFYPDKNILPSTQQYDLTDEEVVNNQYSKYIEYWNSDYNTNGNIEEMDKYKPIIMGIKLNENMSNNTPFFYESNEAKLKFNIRRVDPKLIDDTSNSKYSPEGVTVNLAINQRYYLADFIKVNSTVKVMNSIGSYPKYNEDSGKFEIYEYFDNRINESSTIYPKPIYYENGVYNYIIDKCAKLNKLHFSNALFNGHPIDNTFIDQHILYYFDANINNLMTLLGNDNNMSALFTDNNGLKLILNDGVIYGSKNYLNLTVSSAPEIIINIVHRVKPTSLQETINIIDPYLEAPNNIINTNKTNDGTFEIHLANDEIGTFRHYQFYSLSNIINEDTSHELLEVPNANKLNKIYIYSSTDNTMKPLSSYKELNNGINKSSYESYYSFILDAFNMNKIYERLD